MKEYIPNTIYLEVTNHCNARCIMCPNGRGLMSRPKGYMTWELFKKIVDECTKFDKIQFYLDLHGEPLLGPMLHKRIRYIKDKIKISKVGINTNGELLDEKKSIELIESNIDRIIFSIDGASSYTYEEIRRTSKYSKIVENINRYFELRKNANKKPFTTLQMVVCDKNEHEIDKFKELWNGKADSIYIKPMHNFLDMGTSTRTKCLSNKQVRQCIQPYSILPVYWSGNAALCCWDYDNFVELGNLREDSVMSVFNNEQHNNIRDLMDKFDCKSIVPCNRCSQIYGND